MPKTVKSDTLRTVANGKVKEGLQKQPGFLKRELISVLFALFILPGAVSQASGEKLPQSNKKMKMTDVPSVVSYTSAPLRNRIHVVLTASISEVWLLAGDLSRLPEYSVGLEHVDVDAHANGTLKGYVCHFKPQEEGGERFSLANNVCIAHYFQTVLGIPDID